MKRILLVGNLLIDDGIERPREGLADFRPVGNSQCHDVAPIDGEALQRESLVRLLDIGKNLLKLVRGIDPARAMGGLPARVAALQVAKGAEELNIPVESREHAFHRARSRLDHLIVVLHEREQKKYISETFGAIACEMEGAAIGHVCYVNKVPFCARFANVGDILSLDMMPRASMTLTFACP